MIDMLERWYCATCAYLGIEPDTVSAAVQATIRSAVFTAPGMMAALYFMAVDEVGSAGAGVEWTWILHNWWPFLFAQVVSPALRGLAAGYTTHKAANQTPTTTE